MPARKVNRFIGRAVLIFGLPPVFAVPLGTGIVVGAVLVNTGRPWPQAGVGGVCTTVTVGAILLPRHWEIINALKRPPNWIRGVERYESLEDSYARHQNKK